MKETLMFYPVTLTKDSNGTILVRFPDVPDAVTFGETKEEALTHAVDALLTVFDAYMKDKRDIPTPSTLKGAFVEVPALDASKLALYQTMRKEKVTKSELGRRLNWHLPQVDRVLQVRHGSQLEQLEAAFAAVGKRLTVMITDRDQPLVPGAIIAKTRARTVATKRAAPGRSISRKVAKKR
jgi:antitoxin HicB